LLLSSNNKKNINDILNKLIKISVENNDDLYWIGYNFTDVKTMEPVNGNDFVNFGLAHGLPSLLVSISKVYGLLNTDINIKDTVNKTLNYLLNNKLQNTEDSFFSQNSISNSPSRLAWCYGDPGVASAIRVIGNQFNRNDWINFSKDVFKHSQMRLDQTSTGVIDAGICHGTAGLALIFKRQYLATGILDFDRTSKYWINETLLHSKFSTGLAGYKAYNGPDDGWINDIGLLEGISGIGLVLLSSITDVSQDWDKCLLIN
jgi:lantibiotic modifying enzyme